MASTTPMLSWEAGDSTLGISEAGANSQPGPAIYCKLCLSELPSTATRELKTCNCVFCTAVSRGDYVSFPPAVIIVCWFNTLEFNTSHTDRIDELLWGSSRWHFVTDTEKGASRIYLDWLEKASVYHQYFQLVWAGTISKLWSNTKLSLGILVKSPALKWLGLGCFLFIAAPLPTVRFCSYSFTEIKWFSTKRSCGDSHLVSIKNTQSWPWLFRWLIVAVQNKTEQDSQSLSVFLKVLSVPCRAVVFITELKLFLLDWFLPGASKLSCWRFAPVQRGCQIVAGVILCPSQLSNHVACRRSGR